MNCVPCQNNFLQILWAVIYFFTQAVLVMRFNKETRDFAEKEFPSESGVVEEHSSNEENEKDPGSTLEV